MKEGYIEIPENKLRDLVRKVYDMSVPVGMGFLHAKPGGLTDEEVEELIRLPKKREFGKHEIIYMDYVNGRQCKMSVYVFCEKGMEDKFGIRDSWYDHTDRQLKELLDHLGVPHDAG